MLTTAPRDYGVTDPAPGDADVGPRVSRGDHGRQVAGAADRQDALVPADQGRRRLRRLRGRRRGASFEPARGRPRRLGADLDRQRDRLRRQTVLPAGVSYTTVETKANFSRPITKDTGRVRAEGRVVGRGRRIISCEGRIVDAGGRLLAHGTSTLMVLAVETNAAAPPTVAAA